VAVEIELLRQSGVVRVRRVVAAVDTGQVVNPDGIRNQIEGGILQSMSWTLFEQVTFDRTRVTSVDWSAYPIMRFGSVPGSLEVHVIDRPGDAFYGVAEAAQGPAGAAIANAIRDATGVRLHDLPFTSARIKKAIGDWKG
jgi:CO/xanthine dehydrogenase Mo-binding subunit